MKRTSPPQPPKLRKIRLVAGKHLDEVTGGQSTGSNVAPRSTGQAST